MKRMKLLGSIAVLVATFSQAQVFGLTITDLGTAAPDPSDYYISQPVNGTSSSTTRTNAFQAPGQTFTTSALTGGISGLDVTNIVVQLASVNNNGIVKGGVNSLSWTLQVGTMSGSTFTSLDSESVTPSSTTFTAGHYIDFGLSSPVELTGNAQYAFEISTPAINLLKYVTLDSSSSDSYAGGSLTSFSRLNSNTTERSGDLTFYVETAPVPEPVNWAWIPVLGTAAFFGFRRFRCSSVA